jgi:anthranilate synthase component 1
LLADPKERAEHLMLIDLGRNDVGRVSQPAACRWANVRDRALQPRHAHRQRSHRHPAPRPELCRCAAATFPAGTVSGAPKIRALEVIRELEPVKRNIYSGAVGYIELARRLPTPPSRSAPP